MTLMPPFIFLDVSDDDKIEGGVRITPTETCSLTADYFPHLVENGEVLRSPEVYEATRYFILPTQKSAARNRTVRARILKSLTEWCLDNRISFIQAVIDTTSLPTFIQLNPEVRRWAWHNHMVAGVMRRAAVIVWRSAGHAPSTSSKPSLDMAA